MKLYMHIDKTQIYSNILHLHFSFLKIRGIQLFVYWEYMEWNFPYTENTWNETFHILRIRGMKLSVFWEYKECTKNSKIPVIWSQNKKYLTWLIRSSVGSFCQTSLKQKIWHKCTFKDLRTSTVTTKTSATGISRANHNSIVFWKACCLSICW
jgi:hypothetical protein